MNIKWGELTLAESAKLADARYRFDTDNVPALDTFPGLQAALAAWQQRCFGSPPPWVSAMGINEEVGELREAAPWEADFDDALGDILVYTTQLCTLHKLDFGALSSNLREIEVSVDVGWKLIGVATGRISHVVLKSFQKIRGFHEPEVAQRHIAHAVIQLTRGIRALAPMSNTPVLRELYFQISHDVLKREWDKDKVTAGGHA